LSEQRREGALRRGSGWKPYYKSVKGKEEDVLGWSPERAELFGQKSAEAVRMNAGNGKDIEIGMAMAGVVLGITLSEHIELLGYLPAENRYRLDSL